MKILFWLVVGLVAVGTAVFVGCSDRATRVAIEAADRQAGQNQELARLDREHASARKELVELHQQVQSERQALSTGWSDLHQERQTVIKERRTESLFRQLAPVLLALIVAVAVLWLVGYWLDYQSLQLALQAGIENSPPLTGAETIGLDSTPSLLPTGELHESLGHHHHPGA